MTLETFLRRQPQRCAKCGFHVPTQSCRCLGSEWQLFLAALRQSVRADGTVHIKDVRPLIRKKIPAKHIGLLWRRARKEGLIEETGTWEQSDDTQGRNAHRVEMVYSWSAAA